MRPLPLAVRLTVTVLGVAFPFLRAAKWAFIAFATARALTRDTRPDLPRLLICILGILSTLTHAFENGRARQDLRDALVPSNSPAPDSYGKVYHT
jgi:hypothetical protein